MGSGELVLDTTHVQSDFKLFVRRTCAAIFLACYMNFYPVAL